VQGKSPHFLKTTRKATIFSCALFFVVLVCGEPPCTSAKPTFFMKKVLLKQQKTILFVDIEKIIAVKVEDYVCKCLLENSAINYAISLREFEQKLPDFFIKISRNCLINSQKIEYIDLQNKKIKVANHIFDISCRNLTKIRQIFHKK
jgi:DNA-binding LytR/AlgR family response regulator